MFFVDLEALRVDRQGVICGAGEFTPGTRFGHKDEAVVTAVVLEEVGDAPFFGEALEEGEIRLAVLDFPFELGEGAFVQALVDAEGVVGQDVVEDGDDALVLEGFVVAGLGGEPEPGAQGESVEAVVGDAADHLGAGDEAGDVALTGANAAQQASADAVQFNG
ncbi:hypothetical protein LMG18102_04507 [Ralstonia mannitolilytica]|nr:hypothetical protein LMG18102_04507 [Ralstonia mannitolilytica]